MIDDLISKWQGRLAPRLMLRLAFGLVVGAAGGFVAQYFEVPLAWMLGPLFFCMAASIAGLPAEVPLWMRANFMLFIGLFLGESFDGLTVSQILRWPVSMAGAAIYLPLSTAVAYVYYRRVVREHPVEALCSSVPGGLTALVLVSGGLGADERRVALAQSLRIALVVCMAPFVAFVLMGYRPDAGGGHDAPKIISPGDFAILLAASMALIAALRKTQIPILAMICPLTVSAVLRLAGVVEGVMPHWLVEIALLVLGSSIGGRFQGVGLGQLVRYGALTLGGTGLLMAVAAGMAFGVSAITGLEVISLLLAYAPGGVAEMSLIAFAIDADPGFVAIHHVVRIILVMIAVPLIVVYFTRANGRANAAKPDAASPETQRESTDL